jgi:Carboxypeptidase regulatory-like domain/TonB dependent receptor
MRHSPLSARYCEFLKAVLPALILAVMTLAVSASGQSTFGSILGTIRDDSGAVINGATVTLANTDTGLEQKTMSGNGGSYIFINLEAGRYKVAIARAGFAAVTITDLDLQARETKRVDANLKVGAQSESTTVEGTAAGVITTEVSNVSEDRTGRELVDLPVAIYSRASGSTSPISTLTTQAGVQTDNNGDLAVAGTAPGLMSVTLDGISTMVIEYAGPINELFPSFNSISEMKVSQVNNSAEFSGVSDITTTSKSGTNELHGGVFENHENRALASNNEFAASKPKLILNDFGGFLGGPIIREKTFFFASYEGLRLPREVPITTSVPSSAMRSGNLCSYLQAQHGNTNVQDAYGNPLPCDAVPISPVAANVLNYLMPAPTNPNSYVNNFQENFPAPISSDQGDLRIDQTLSQRQSMFGRLTYKSRSVSTPPDPNTDGALFYETAGSPSTGPFSQPETDSNITLAYNFAIRPNLINELRGGWSRYHLHTTLNINSQSLLGQVGITGIPNPDSFGAVPYFSFDEGGLFQQTGGANPSTQISDTLEIGDNLTWQKGKHIFKFGADWRRYSDHDDNAFGALRSGFYSFDGSSPVGQTIGDPFASFLLGYPDWMLITLVSSKTVDENMNAVGYSYGFFAQDDWKVTPSLTLNLGLRYELHPPLYDEGHNSSNFLPNYQATIAGQAVNGALVVPDQQALSLTEPGLAASIAPTPILTASQAGIPSGLRFTYKKDIAPRIGFAWRPFHDDRTVVRGGYGLFYMTPLGFNVLAGWATTSSFIPYFGNGYSGGAPLFSLPAPFPSNLDAAQPGQSYLYGFPIHYMDPRVQQWNLTFERNLGYDIGLRLSYIGSHGSNLQDMVNLNQVPANTIGYYQGAINNVPYPLWGQVDAVANLAESNYNAVSVEAQKRLSKGLQFDASYTFTRDLSDAGGTNPTTLPIESTGALPYVSDRFHPLLDYGNISYDRRHRFLLTGLYDLPFGRGKTFASGSSGFTNAVIGGWEWAGVVTLESGPFLTPYQTANDSAGTNNISFFGSERADIVPAVSHYVPQTASFNPDGSVASFNYLNPAAFAIPGGTSPIGRYGNAGVGSVLGPSTKFVSMSLIKTIPLAEKAKFQFGAEASNVFNHKNYQPPNMQVGSPAFGTITALQTVEGAGPRLLELTARINF